ncbi:MAG: glycine--tRNA ligase subunit beta [Anaerolineae bacterium]|nr:glycine--tRNA ligase subunit beta [Anaerolineae bacterium]
MSNPLTFQQALLRLQQFWADHGCLIWQPYSEKVGAGTMNPATILRVLGPEPWNVAYVEPSYRPDDGRYGENPNRMQMHTQLQVILKPDPGNPQELYLQSLEALGIRRQEHDVRFVEDNWETPALGAWGLGWEVWLDGLEITQFTYFQQAGGFNLEPPAVEITYGLERIIMFLQRVRSVWDIRWDGAHTYGDVYLEAEVEHCRYGFELADVDTLRQLYDLYEAEAYRCLEAGLVIPAHDHVLRCSHAFNLLDTRGAVGVTERATFFRRMREMAQRTSQAYLEQRQRLEYPWLETVPGSQVSGSRLDRPETWNLQPATFLLEIGSEELPAGDLDSALAQLRERVPALLAEARLEYEGVRVVGTPRRMAVLVDGLSPRQRAVEEWVKGPPARAAFDASGRPTQAAVGFARKHGLPVDELAVREIDGGEYVVAVRRQEGRPAAEVLGEVLPDLVAGLSFQKSMRWNETGVAFSRPLRWYVSLLGERVVPFEYAGVQAGRSSRGPRPAGSPPFDVARAGDYLDRVAQQRIVVDPAERRAAIAAQAAELAQSVGGRVVDDPDLLQEVTHLVEQPTAFLGRFDPQYLALPAAVLIAVMKKHQRYFPVYDPAGRLLPYFVAVRNGGPEHLDVVRQGNEEVIRARFADADYFYREDTRQPLQAFLPRLDTLTFQETLGSVRQKSQRLEKLAPELCRALGLDGATAATAARAAHLCKADLATQMVVEFTSLQGVMGREYALQSGEPPAVAEAIFDHYLPRFAGDALPAGQAGLVVGLADRLDSLAGLFAVGMAPSGSTDPYGLRRSALGMVQILIAAGLSFSVAAGLSMAASLLPVAADAAALQAAREFVAGRLRVYLRDQGLRYDVVEAVLAARGDDPFRAQEAAGQLSRWIERGDWPRILDNYARCVRITRSFDAPLALEPDRLVEPAEEELYAAYRQARSRVTPSSSVDDFLTAFLPLVDVIDRFFARESGVLVMDDDPVLRENRLALLQHVAGLAEGIADLGQLEGF